MKSKSGRPQHKLIDSTVYHDLERRSLALEAMSGSTAMIVLARTDSLPDSALSDTVIALVSWLDGRIDGGDMDGCYPAMDYQDTTLLDGGEL